MESNTKSLIEEDSAAIAIRKSGYFGNLQIFEGFIGSSEQEGFVRLYLQTEMRSFLELKKDDIVHFEKRRIKGCSLEGTALWVKSEAALDYRVVESRRLQADYLRGSLDKLERLKSLTYVPIETTNVTSLITFTTIVTTPTCAVIMGITFSICGGED